MSKYSKLMAEAEHIRRAYDFGLLEALEFILRYEEEYSSEVRRELREFMREGAALFAEV